MRRETQEVKNGGVEEENKITERVEEKIGRGEWERMRRETYGEQNGGAEEEMKGREREEEKKGKGKD